MLELFTQSSSFALWTLFILTLVGFVDNFARYILAVSPIPYIDYSSVEYSVLAGPAFTAIYGLGGLVMTLGYVDTTHKINSDREHDGENKRDSQETRSLVHIQGERQQVARSKTWSKSNLLSIATFCFSLAVFSIAFGTQFYQQLLFRLVMGLTQSVITPFAAALLKERVASSVAGAAFAIFNSGTYFAFSLSLSLGVYLFLSYGWRAGYLLFGLIGMFTAVLLPLLNCVYSWRDRRAAAHSSREVSVTQSVLHSERANSERNVATDSPTEDIERESLTCEARSPAECNITENEAIYSDYIHGLSLWQRIRFHLIQIAWVCWAHTRHRGGVYVLCAATAFRLGGGFVWSAYTGPYFSALFVFSQTNNGVNSASDSCLYSYNASDVSAASNACGADYPYCVDGSCAALTENPWHNKGMDAFHLVTYMSWVPIVGSALGGVLAGFLSDYIVRTHSHDTQPPSPSTISQNNRTHNEAHTSSSLLAHSHSHSHGEPFSIDISQHDDGETRNAVDVQPQQASSAVCLRALIAGVSTLLSLPLVVASFSLDFPGCFLIFIASGLVGEVYLSQSFALITDVSIVPKTLVAASVALFNLLVTVVGGNFPLFVPLLSEFVGYKKHVNISFTAAAMAGTGVEGDVTFNVLHKDARNLQFSMMYALVGCYSISGLLYVFAFFLLKKNSK